jgi:glycosyltransferase involved in cell wall biosynthesis
MLRVLRAESPDVLFVTNPSLALATLALICRPLFGYYLVIDAHNEGVRPFDRPGVAVRWLTRWLLRSANATVVSNENLARDVRSAGGDPFVLSDCLPEPPPRSAGYAATAEAPEVVVIATFRRDEPISAIVAAAASLRDVTFAFSGDKKRFATLGIDLPANATLNGFLPDDDYWALLQVALVICDLTLKPDCLVCGAYEALALEKAMVLSDNAATREIFGPAAILTNGEAEDIARAVRTAIDERNRLESNAGKLREQYGAPWRAQAAIAWDAIREGATVSRRGVV